MAPKKKEAEKKEEELAGKEDVGVFVFHDGSRYDGQYLRRADASAASPAPATSSSPGGGAAPSSSSPVQLVKRHGNGVYLDTGAQMDGQWVEDELCGEATISFDSGASYVGSVWMDMFHGRGTYTWPDGSLYDGFWRANAMHGEGVYVDVEGGRWVGKFYNGLGVELNKEIL